MGTQPQETAYISLNIAVQRTGLSLQVVRECVTRNLVVEPLTEVDVARLRRIRRLQELGVNMQGIEIILHMRRRIEAMQAELDLWEGQWARSIRLESLRSRPHLLPWNEDEG